MNRAPSPSTRLPLLDGMRGIAAIGVMLFHLHPIFGIRDVMSHGYLSVDFFFMLSGFVLTLAAEPRLAATAPARRFLIGRFLRFWPMVLLGTALGMVLQSVEGASFAALLPGAVAAALMLPLAASPNAIFPLNGPQWSLMMELLANAVHATILHRLPERSLAAIVIVCALLLAPLILAQGWSNFGPFSWNWTMAAPRVLFSYTLGVLVARRWQRDRVLPAALWWLPLALLLAVLVTISLAIPSAIGDLVATLVLMPTVFVLATMARPPLAAERWLTAMGRLSFPLYATQIPILMLVRIALGPASLPIAMACALGAAYVIGLALERRVTPRRPLRLATA